MFNMINHQGNTKIKHNEKPRFTHRRAEMTIVTIPSVGYLTKRN